MSEFYIKGKGYEIIPNVLNYVDFRFSNNAPGIIYYGKVEIAENELIKIQTLIQSFYNVSKKYIKR